MDPYYHYYQHQQMYVRYMAPPVYGVFSWLPYDDSIPYMHPQGRVDGSPDTSGCPPPSGFSQPSGSGSTTVTASTVVRDIPTPSLAQPLSVQQATTSQSTASVDTQSRDGSGPDQKPTYTF